MVGGNLLAVTQRDVKRMLAYSSVANAGYMMVAHRHPYAGILASALLIYLASLRRDESRRVRRGAGDRAARWPGDDAGRLRWALAGDNPGLAAADGGLPPGAGGHSRRRWASSASATSSTQRCRARISSWRSSACWPACLACTTTCASSGRCTSSSQPPRHCW